MSLNLEELELIEWIHNPRVAGPMDYTTKFTLDAGDTLLSATMRVLDDDGVEVSSPDITLSNFAYAALPNVTDNEWGVTWYAQGGSDKTYNITADVVLSGSPTRAASKTVRLRSKIT